MKVRPGSLWIWFVVIALVVVLFFPLYILFKISVSEPQEIFMEKGPYLIRHFTPRHFSDIFASGASFFSPLKKSFVTALAASMLTLLLAIPAAYVLSKFDYRLRYLVLLVMFVTRMMPEVSIALPVSIAFIKTGLFDTTAGLILAHMIKIFPISCFILTGVFAAFPAELERQARIDGCSRLKALIRVVLPLSLGGVSVAALFSFLLSWDEFIYASYLCLARPTMPLKMFYYVSRGNIFYSATYAVIIAVPVLFFTLLLQRYLKPGYLAGAVKG